MSIKTINCEMCGREISARAGIRVNIEGAVMTLCPTCFARYSSGRRREAGDKAPQSPPPSGKKAKPSGESQRKARPGPRIEKYEVVKDFSERIREARERQGMSARDLANMIRESENIVKRIESGKLVPTIELARRIEGVLKIQLVVPSVDQEAESPPSRQEPVNITLGDVLQLRKKQG